MYALKTADREIPGYSQTKPNITRISRESHMPFYNIYQFRERRRVWRAPSNVPFNLLLKIEYSNDNGGYDEPNESR